MKGNEMKKQDYNLTVEYAYPIHDDRNNIIMSLALMSDGSYELHVNDNVTVSMQKHTLKDISEVIKKDL